VPPPLLLAGACCPEPAFNVWPDKSGRGGRMITASRSAIWFRSRKEKLRLAEGKELDKQGEVKEGWQSCPMGAYSEIGKFRKCHSSPP